MFLLFQKLNLNFLLLKTIAVLFTDDETLV